MHPCIPMRHTFGSRRNAERNGHWLWPFGGGGGVQAARDEIAAACEAPVPIKSDALSEGGSFTTDHCSTMTVALQMSHHGNPQNVYLRTPHYCCGKSTWYTLHFAHCALCATCILRPLCELEYCCAVSFHAILCRAAGAMTSGFQLISMALTPCQTATKRGQGRTNSVLRTYATEFQRFLFTLCTCRCMQ